MDPRCRRMVSWLRYACLIEAALLVAMTVLGYRTQNAMLATSKAVAAHQTRLRSELEHTRNERDLAHVCAFALGSRLATLGRIYSGHEPARSNQEFQSLLFNPDDRTAPPLLPECESIGSTIHHPPSAPPR